MFFPVYKNTLKTLLRSLVFWCSIVIVLFLVLERAIQINYGYTIVENNKIIKNIVDTDPEFVLSYDYYFQIILNATRSWVMLYAMPIFCVLSVVLIINRDTNDGFFEVEKAGGCKPSAYFFGRLIALISVNTVVCLGCSIISVHYYYFSRGCIEGFNVASYFIDSTIRVTRLFCFSMFPAILFFIGLTYMIGSLLKNGFFGAVVGLGYILFDYGTKTFLRSHFSEMYHDYLNPKPDKLYQYWGYYNTEFFTEKIYHNPFSNSQMLICISVVVLISIIFLVSSFISLKKRNT